MDYTREIQHHRKAIHELAALRRRALYEAKQQGFSVSKIASTLGISRQQVHRLINVRENP